MLSLRPLALLAAALLMALPGCSGVADLGDTDSGGAAPPLAAEEQAGVRARADEALAEKRFNAAWNQEVTAGADRARLERIALAALDGRSRHAEDMLAGLRAKFAGLSPDARRALGELVSQAQAQGAWARALDLELLAADDAPTYAGAWRVYRAAPVGLAPSLLESIQGAREEHAEASD